MIQYCIHSQWIKLATLQPIYCTTHTGVVSLTFRQFYKLILRKYTMPEIIFIARTGGCNHVRVPKTWHKKCEFCNTKISREYFEARKTLVQHSLASMNFSLVVYLFRRYLNLWQYHRAYYSIPRNAMDIIRQIQICKEILLVLVSVLAVVKYTMKYIISIMSILYQGAQ